MAIDPFDATLARIGEALDMASERFKLAADGLDYINPDANCGANDPAEETGVLGVSYAVEWTNRHGERDDYAHSCSLTDTMAAASRDHRSHPRDTVRVVQFTRTVVYTFDPIAERCGHA